VECQELAVISDWKDEVFELMSDLQQRGIIRMDDESLNTRGLNK
jgi:hypothetical protein